MLPSFFIEFGEFLLPASEKLFGILDSNSGPDFFTSGLFLMKK
jgi:hypothetical protein